jgi:tetratricopeptide (TPR) repeat protein
MAGIPSVKGWVLAAAFLWAAAWLVLPSRAPSFSRFERPVIDYYAVQDLGAVLNGARRLGADLAFIQLLQYYGSGEYADPHRLFGRKWERSQVPARELGHEGHDHGHDAESDDEKPRPSWPLLNTFTLRVGSLDPYFHYAYLFGGGALAFTQRRYDEALSVLQEAAKRDPSFWRYRLYQGAIAYGKGAEMNRAIPLLEEAIRQPDCPSMVKNILANMHKKAGNPRRAAEIFVELIETSRDQEYVALARQRLKEMGIRLPE